MKVIHPTRSFSVDLETSKKIQALKASGRNISVLLRAAVDKCYIEMLKQQEFQLAADLAKQALEVKNV